MALNAPQLQHRRAAWRWLTWPGLAAIGLLVACAAALDDPLARAASPSAAPDWPPAWQPERPPAPDFGAPGFEPPRAQHCRRQPTTREVPGAAANRFPSPWREERSAAAAGTVAEAVDAREAAKTARADAASDRAVPAAPAAQAELQRMPTRPRETVTAGVVDDNADFGEYLAYRRRHAGLAVRERDVSERYLLEVTDAAGRPVHDAEVAVQRAGVAEPLAWARTDTAGRVWLHPRAFAGQDSDRQLGIAVRKGAQQARAVLVRGDRAAVQVRLGAAPAAQRPRLDLVFLIDATGSMGDEIAKLKHSMRAMAQQIAQLPGQPDICWGLVAYRDRGDAFLTRMHDFTDDLGAFQQVLARVQAQGGGDMPEALNEALHEVVHGLSWRADAARMVVLVADAPPHLDYGGPQYDTDMQAALAKGIKLFAVGASGLDPVGEYVFRQLAQYTAGRFVFLTYRDASDPGSGPGTQTPHDVRNYSVQTLDRLVVRLVSEEMARLSRS
ncbi:vWA domain-containing protein [Caldimonas sp. KR1-144]|uniref:vWA domain-containing protein n=1 Tax=Caldimonas sp. KR1-144 TaxID=3400911 RepID=UPI003C100DF0